MTQFDQAWVDAQNAKRKPREPESVTAHDGPESEIHNDIIKHCRDNGWIYFHGSMAHKTMRTIGEPDFTCLLPNGRVLFVEAKRKGGKLSPEQLALKLWMERIGHKLHVVYSLDEFKNICQSP